MVLTREAIYRLLISKNLNELRKLWKNAHDVRLKNCGSKVYYRGIIEISNYCLRNCTYCGIRGGRKGLTKYRMSPLEIMDIIKDIDRSRCDTVILQSGEDPCITTIEMENLIGSIRKSYPKLSLTLSLGERDLRTYRKWKAAGAERYLLKMETTNKTLYQHIRPKCKIWSRIRCLKNLKKLGYQVGTGTIVGLPGQSVSQIVNDIIWLKNKDFDMLAIGPYIKHPNTPLGKNGVKVIHEEKIDHIFLKNLISIVRILCPKANIPATTAVGVLYSQEERHDLLSSGANVIMENFTPEKYRGLYDIYPKNVFAVNKTIE